jgi:hypothetical protein
MKEGKLRISQNTVRLLIKVQAPESSVEKNFLLIS